MLVDMPFRRKAWGNVSVIASPAERGAAISTVPLSFDGLRMAATEPTLI